MKKNWHQRADVIFEAIRLKEELCIPIVLIYWVSQNLYFAATWISYNRSYRDSDFSLEAIYD